MATVQESIEVNVPLSQAYNQWTQFEDFPHFMSGVESVNQLDDTTVHFKTSIGGVKREYDARITAQEPDQRVSWESLDEPRNAGTVWFDDLGERRGTKVNVELSWEPDSAAEKIGAAIGLDSRQVACRPEEIQAVHRRTRGRDRRLARNGGGRRTRGRRSRRRRRRRQFRDHRRAAPGRSGTTARSLPSSAWTPTPTSPPSRLSATTSTR